MAGLMKRLDKQPQPLGWLGVQKTGGFTPSQPWLGVGRTRQTPITEPIPEATAGPAPEQAGADLTGTAKTRRRGLKGRAMTIFSSGA